MIELEEPTTLKATVTPRHLDMLSSASNLHRTAEDHIWEKVVEQGSIYDIDAGELIDQYNHRSTLQTLIRLLQEGKEVTFRYLLDRQNPTEMNGFILSWDEDRLSNLNPEIADYIINTVFDRLLPYQQDADLITNLLNDGGKVIFTLGDKPDD